MKLANRRLRIALAIAVVLMTGSGIAMADDEVTPGGSRIQRYESHESAFRLERGTDALEAAFARAGVTEVLDVSRKSAVGKRGFFNFLRN